MNHTFSRNVIWLTLIGLFLVGCVSQPAAPVSEVSSPTQVPPTSTHMPPTDTSAPPTATQVPPTPTSAPPTVKPTGTIAPTSTAAPSVFDPPSENPSPRDYVSLAYDSESDKIILFGGQTGVPEEPDTFTGATWAYDMTTNNWTQMKPTTGPRGGAVGMAYDIESDRVIIFGSIPEGETWDRSNLNETWAYDYNTNTWTKLADGPTKHLGARIAYDAESDRVILFGGYRGGSALLDDTWAYDYNTDTWTRMEPATKPPGRNYQGLTYDSKADRVLTYGGTTIQLKPHLTLWAYDFNTDTWQEMVPGEGPSPGFRDYNAMVYDAESDRTILYGGDISGDSTGAIWSYDYSTNTWEKHESSTGPDNRRKHGMAYALATDRTILFGGMLAEYFKYLNDTWSYDLNTNTWTNMTSQP